MLDKLLLFKPSDKEYSRLVNPDSPYQAWQKEPTKSGLAKATSVTDRARRKTQVAVKVIAKSGEVYHKMTSVLKVDTYNSKHGFKQATARVLREQARIERAKARKAKLAMQAMLEVV